MADVAIEYTAKILEVKNNIEQLESLGIKCDIYVSNVEEIQSITNIEVDECCSKFKDFEPFLQDSLKFAYTSAIKKLDKVNDRLNKLYKNYYDVKLRYEELEEKIKAIDVSNIKEFVDQVIILLKELKNSPTINYEEKKHIIEKVYE